MTGGPTRIRVGADEPYDVVVGTEVLGELPGILGSGAQRAAVVFPEVLPGVGRQVCGALERAGHEAHPFPVPDGERAKDIDVARGLWSGFAAAGITRSDTVVGVGGGATTDLAGFVAATWLRGVRVVLVPTTLLGMVDAAIGGKTAVNTAEGKNLVGAFHPPAGVLCDLDFLGSLRRDDYVGGLAEIIKAGFIADPAILDLIESDPEGACTPAGPHTRELVERSVRVKASVVTRDLRETGLREALNYGHTLGHAIELVEGYRWRHGAAVSVGMVFAAELARHAGLLDPTVVKRHRQVLESVGLPTSYRGDAWPKLHEAMHRDKKARGSRLRFVVLQALARVTRLEDPDTALLASAYEEVTR
ncbi:MAG: 3-dehydroquinate synthase [Streptosporangiales bacterium]|nr:3-dehydroquinate synthase [Streptosporangiales bacterium]